MISDSKKQQLATKYIFKNSFKPRDLDKLSIQELFFLIKSCELFKSEEGFDNEGLNERIALFEDVAKNKLNQLDTLYVLYDNSTSYLYYDDIDAVELFTSSEYAERALDFYRNKQHRNLRIVSYSRKTIFDLFSEINRLGLKNILVDKGQFSYKFQSDELLYLKNDNEEMPFMSQSLMEACIKFFTQIRWQINYKDKENILDELQSIMFDEIKKANYLVPIKHVSENKESNEEVTLHFAKIEIRPNNLSYLPLFSDWIEFEKVYDKDEYDCLVMNFDDLIQLLKNNVYDGLLLNPRGINFIMNSNLINNIQQSNDEKY